MADDLGGLFMTALAENDNATMAAVQAELDRRVAIGNTASRAARVRSNIERLLENVRRRTCNPCAAGDCIGGHLYVLELPTTGGVIHYVGSTGKTVEERLEDNFVMKDAASYKYNAPSTKLIRTVGRERVRIATELFAHLNPVARSGDKGALEAAEGELASALEGQGLVVWCDKRQ